MKTTAEAARTAPDIRLLKALGHPVRQKILVALKGRVASPSDLAQELGEPLSNVSYHIKILLESEAIELVKTEPRRGAIEHFYRPTMTPRIEDPEHWAQLSVNTRRALFDESMREIWQQAADAAGSGGFDPPDVHVSWTPLALDDEAIDELNAQIAKTVELAQKLHEQSVARRGEADGDGGRRTLLAIMHFDRTARNGSGSSDAAD